MRIAKAVPGQVVNKRGWKIFIALLVVVGCGGEATAPAAGTAEVAEAVGEELLSYGSEAAAQLGLDTVYSGDFPGSEERRALRVLVPYSRTYYFIENSRQQGITYEALKNFEEMINKAMGRGHMKMLVVPIPTSRDRLIEGLIEGRGDLAAAGLTITPERTRLVDFSDPFSKKVREIVVTAAGQPALASVDDLAGRTVYVRRSSSYYESLEALNERFESEGRPKVDLQMAEESLEDEDLLEMLNAGLIETVVIDEHKAELWAQIFDDVQVHPDIAVREGAQVAWAFRKESPELATLVNRFVAENKQGTLMGNILIKRYWNNTKWIKSALAGEERKRYAATVDLFREYSERYDFDYLMMMAQGFQESGLDQSVVSPVGALGVMQVLPTTAADKSVGIPDISTPEPNIHAGIKYMRWIVDTYFDDESVDERNKVFFAFASYNAGPNRIRRFRHEAGERGLDPDKWFGNVELIAAEQIGRETVQYVGNIYKYYAAYRLVEEQDRRRAEARRAVS